MPVISSKPYIAGDVVFKCKPLMVWIDYKYKGKLCDNCLKSMDQLKRCSKCHQMNYCGKNCQTIDWSFHKNECKVFRGKTITALDVMCLPFQRFYLRMKSDKTFATKRHTLIDGSDVCLNELKSNYNMNNISEDLFRAFLTNVDSFNRFHDIDCNVPDFVGCVQLMFANNSMVSYISDNPNDLIAVTGSALSLAIQPLSHSCVPNTTVICGNDGWLEIRAIKPIAVGEEMTMSRILLNMNRDGRRRQLNGSSIVCNCDKCRLHLDKHMDYQEFNELNVKEINHWSASQSSISSNVNFSYEMNNKLMKYLEEIYGEFHPHVSYSLLKSFICFAKSKKASHSLLTLWFKRIERHVLVTHGSDHPWYAMLCNTFANSIALLLL